MPGWSLLEELVMFTALLLLFFVIMIVVFFARALSQQRWSQRAPDDYPDMSQMQQQQMPPQAAPYSDPYSDTGYYQPGQEQAAPPPKEADTYDQGYAAGYTARPEPGTTPRADEEGDIYKARSQPEPRGNYDSSYYRPGANDATRPPERPERSEWNIDADADAPPPRRQEPRQPSNQGPYPPQRPDYSPQQPPMQQYQQSGYNQQMPPMQYPQQPDGYGQQLPPQYQQPFYGPFPPQQRSGMNPWVVGGLGALMGYGLGHMFGEEQGRDMGSMGGDFGGGGGDFGDGGGDFGGDGGDFGGGDSGGGDF